MGVLLRVAREYSMFFSGNKILLIKERKDFSMCLSKLFRKKNQTQTTTTSAPAQTFAPRYKTMTFTFNQIPTSLAELQALPEASLNDPFKAAALTMLALCAYAKNAKAGIQMLNYLRGPRPMSPMEEQFIRDRFMDNGKYIPFSYFEGASPDNSYTPSQPFTIKISEFANSYTDDGYALLNLISSGADSPRQLKFRKKGSTGEWFLWEQFVMVGIRTPKANDPWA